ncbi:MAG: hypothetical protein E7369_02915 [Clostridiales bacterium]|nr:hypothetical protein [Clostridiales bacterium]
MKKIIILLLTIISTISFCLFAASCSDGKTVETEVINGGFETADLSGWTVEYGDAFTDDSVSSRKTFTFSYDDKHNVLDVNQTGNWYLSGKGFDLKYSNARTGAIRSNNFTLTDGILSFKLAGGAVTHGKGENAPMKDDSRICFLGVYRAEDDLLLVRQTNEYFFEHTTPYVIPNDYATGSCSTDNFNEYYLDLSEYIGQELYIRVVDNDQSVYYGYISVDDIRIGATATPQAEGEFFTKTRNYQQTVSAPTIYDIANGDFETGSLAGWTVVSGDAFSHEGVNSEKVWWNENITYSRDGNYHYGMYNPQGTGVMRSSEFVLGGSGYVSYKLGGCADQTKTYIRFMMKVDGKPDKEIARFSNFKFWNNQFPYVQNGMRLLNLNQYYTDLSMYLGQTLYIEVVDENTSGDDLGCITLDSVKTYWEEKPVWYTSQSYKAVVNSDIEIESEYQVKNGTFETGDFTGWTLSNPVANQNIAYVSNANGWWAENFPYNKKGNYLLTGIGEYEGNVGTITSSAFTVGGCGFITYMLGGCGDPSKCYISIIDASTNEELMRVSNSYFKDMPSDATLFINKGVNLANMVAYKADLTAFMGRSVKIQIVDNATTGWGLITADSFITYYADVTAIPENTVLARNIKPNTVLGLNNEYQVYNGDFETGTLDGWTLQSKDGDILNVSHEEFWWNEWFDYNKDGEYFLDGFKGVEAATGSLTSSAFTVGGCGTITFKLGGAGNSELCRVEIIDAETSEVLYAFGNSEFKERTKKYFFKNSPIDLAKDGAYEANMVLYKADISSLNGRSVKIRIVDNATENWGLIFADSFITYYESLSDISALAVTATDIKN